jgi:hypothetical protein
MKIARVDVFGYDLKYDNGVEGFDETCPLRPAYLPAHGGARAAALRELGPTCSGST